MQRHVLLSSHPAPSPLLAKSWLLLERFYGRLDILFLSFGCHLSFSSMENILGLPFTSLVLSLGGEHEVFLLPRVAVKMAVFCKKEKYVGSGLLAPADLLQILEKIKFARRRSTAQEGL